MSQALARLNVLIGADLSGLEKSLKTAQQRIQGVGQQLGSVGRGMTRNVTAPLAGVAAGAIAASEQVQGGLRAIRTGTGATGDALAGLEGDFRALAGKVPADLGSVGDAIADLNTRTGATGETLQGLARQALNLSRVTGEDLGNTIRGTTRLFGDWGVATEDQAGRMDSLFRISQRTGIGVGRLSEMTVNFGAQLRGLGLDLDQAAAMLGVWEREGVASEKILSGLSIGVRNLGQIAEKQGITTAEAFRNLRTEIQAVSQEEGIRAAEKVFGGRAATDMALAIREGRLEFEQFAEELAKGGDTIGAAAAETRTFGDSMQMLGQRVMLAAEPLGRTLVDAFDRLQPLIERTIGAVARVIERFGNLSPSVQTAIIATAALAAALGPVLVALGAVVKSIAVVLPGLKFLAAGVALLTSPIGLVVAAVVGLGFVIFKFRKEIGEALGGAVRSVADAFARMVEPIRPFAEAVGGLVASVANFLREFWGLWFAVARKVGGLLLGKFVSDIRTAFEFVGRIVGALTQPFRDVLSALSPAITAIVDVVRGMVARIREFMLGRLTAIIDGVKNQLDRAAGFFRDLRDKVVGNSYIPEMVDGIERQMARLDTVLVKPVEDAADRVAAAFERGAARAAGSFDPAADRISRAMENVAMDGLDAFAAFATGAGSAIGDFVKRALRDLTRLIARMLVVRGLMSAFGGGGFLGSVLGGIAGRARGGPVRAGQSYVVGERGPELFVPRSAGSVVANGALGGAGGPVTLNVNVPPAQDPITLSRDGQWMRALSEMMQEWKDRGGRLD